MATDDSCIDGLPPPGRRRRPPRHGAVRPAVPPRPRGHGVPGRLAAGGGGAVQRAQRAVPRDAAGAGPRRGRPRSSTATWPPPVACGRPGSHGVEVVASHGYLPVPVPQPGGQPAHRPLRRLATRTGCASCATSWPGCATRVDDATVVGLRISVDEQDPSGLPARDRARRLPVPGRPGARRLPEHHDRHLGLAGRLRPHRAGDVVRQRLHRARWPPRSARRSACRSSSGGRINQPQEAERLLADGAADACVMTRALICDPQLPARAAAGELDDIRACIGCNQACIGHFHAGYPISCIQHPETGRELEFGRRRRDGRAPRRVLVVGRRSGWAEGGGRGRRVRPRRGPPRGRPAARRPGAAGPAAARPGRVRRRGDQPRRARRPGPGVRIELGSRVDAGVVDRPRPRPGGGGHRGPALPPAAGGDGEPVPARRLGGHRGATPGPGPRGGGRLAQRLDRPGRGAPARRPGPAGHPGRQRSRPRRHRCSSTSATRWSGRSSGRASRSCPGSAPSASTTTPSTSSTC